MVLCSDRVDQHLACSDRWGQNMVTFKPCGHMRSSFRLCGRKKSDFCRLMFRLKEQTWQIFAQTCVQRSKMFGQATIIEERMNFFKQFLLAKADVSNRHFN